MVQVVTVAQQKGGSGKTTVAVNLAVAARLSGQSVGLLDTDPQGSLGRWFMTRLEAAGGTPDMEFSTASAWGVGYEVEKLRRTCDLVVIDTPPKADSDLRPALREADAVVVPVSASHLDLWATEAVLDLVDRTGKSALTVLNRAVSQTKLTAEIRVSLSALPAPVAEAALGNRVAFAQALGLGQGVGELARRGLASLEVTALAAELNERFA